MIASYLNGILNLFTESLALVYTTTAIGCRHPRPSFPMSEIGLKILTLILTVEGKGLLLAVVAERT